MINFLFFFLLNGGGNANLLQNIFYRTCFGIKLTKMPVSTRTIKHTLRFLVLLRAQYTVGHIRAPLIKQHFISAEQLLSKQRGQEFYSTANKPPPPFLPYTAKFSGREQLDLMKEKQKQKKSCF